MKTQATPEMGSLLVQLEAAIFESAESELEIRELAVLLHGKVKHWVRHTYLARKYNITAEKFR